MSASTTSRPTLKTISELSGFAVPTVSRALKDAPDIGAKTKATVRRIANEIGYVPNRAGVRLKTGKTNVISLVLSTDHDMMNHTARLISAIAGGLRDTPYHMIITPYFPNEDPLKAIRYIVETGSADAVILNQTQPKDERIAYLMDRKFPFATHGRTDWASQHSYFDFDNEVYARKAIADLARRGRKSVLLIAPPINQNYSRNMIDGAFDEAKIHGLTAKILETTTSDDGNRAIRTAVSNELAERTNHDAILCASPAAAMGAIAALEELGFVLGQDIDVYAKEAVSFLTLFRPAILAVREDVGKAGDFLAKAAMQAIIDPNAPPMQGLDMPEF
ncbi:LacI family transcriptional regulator [bacterium]|nr:LacI family transcriptional regulator [bacterium]